MSYVFVDHNSKEGPLTDFEHLPLLSILAVILLIGTYIVIWWIGNAMFGNVQPSLWDFIWQTFLVASGISALCGGF